MDYSEMERAVEAMLFASGESAAMDDMAGILGMDAGEFRKFALYFKDRYNARDGGLEVAVLGDRMQLLTRAEHAAPVNALLGLSDRRARPLSGAALEILAIAAYSQPVTKGYIESLRGVESGYLVNSLVDRGLLEEKGRLMAPGRPALYGTTEGFLRYFGISTLDELPPADSFRPKGEGERGEGEETEASEID